MKNNKFNIEIVDKHSNDDNDEKKQSDDHDDEMESDAQYGFGENYNYWTQHDALIPFKYIPSKYSNLKEEITSNLICSLDISEYNKVYRKAEKFKNGSEQIKAMKSKKPLYSLIDINDNIPLDIANIMSVILYTDYDMLSYNFSKTFRKIHGNE
eukprot:319787_1